MNETLNPFQIEINKWFKQSSNVTDYREGLRLLERSGLFHLLRRAGIPTVVRDGSDAQAMAHQASWSNGYQTCLEHLQYLEIYFGPQEAVKFPSPDFMGIADAIAKGDLKEGDLTKEEKEFLEKE